MNERITPAGEKEIPGKLVRFPANPLSKEPTSKRHWLMAGLASLLIIATACVIWWAFAGRNTVRYVTVPATRGTVTRAVTATGTVNPELTIIVGAAVSGIIQELYCDYNTQVKKGQVCAKIDPRPYQSVVNQNKAFLAVAKAQLEKDKASLAYAKVTSERYAKLVKEDSTSLDSADNAKN